MCYDCLYFVFKSQLSLYQVDESLQNIWIIISSLALNPSSTFPFFNFISLNLLLRFILLLDKTWFDFLCEFFILNNEWREFLFRKLIFFDGKYHDLIWIPTIQSNPMVKICLYQWSGMVVKGCKWTHVPFKL